MHRTAPTALPLSYKGSGTPLPAAPTDLHSFEDESQKQPRYVGPADSTWPLSGADAAGAASARAAQPPLRKISRAAQGGCGKVARIGKQGLSDLVGHPLIRSRRIDWDREVPAKRTGTRRTSAEAGPDGERTKLRKTSRAGPEVPPNHWTSPRVDCRIV